ncbi:hypothetical protein KBC70_02740 [Candidatus Woesebacteria bacterium]|nr:hypothetical protein [Candidatus Woesebacteria bacterium]
MSRLFDRLKRALPAIPELPEVPPIEEVVESSGTFLENARNRLLPRRQTWSANSQLLELPSDYPVPQRVTRVLMTREELFRYYDWVMATNDNETVWLQNAFIHGGHVMFAQSIQPYGADRTSLRFHTAHNGSREMGEMVTWNFLAWEHLKKLGQAPADVYLDFVGCGHNHPTNVFHRLSTPHDTQNPEESDTKTVERALKQMGLYVALLCRMERSTVPPSVTPSMGRTLKVIKPGYDLAVKVYTATRHNPNPVETDIQLIEAVPYTMPPLSWHIHCFSELEALKAQLQKEGTTFEWSIRSEVEHPLPYVHFVISNDGWKNDVIMQTPHDFPRSAPRVFLNSRYEMVIGPNPPLDLSGIWDGSRYLLRILRNLQQKGHLIDDRQS